MPLPLPGSPSSSWAMFCSRLNAIFHGADKRVVSSFWLFGLINNVLYVIILSAALDLVGPTVPKAVVLLADVVPSFFTKLCAPYFIHLVPYPVRIIIFVGLSVAGMLLIGLTPGYKEGGTISTKMAGVILASLSSGGGELSFLGLTHFYGPFSLAAWGSGTGGAGLIGAGAYALATTTFKFSVRATILASAFLPIIMLVSFFVILPRGPLQATRRHREQPEGDPLDVEADGAEDDQDLQIREDQSLLSPASPKIFRSQSPAPAGRSSSNNFKSNLRRASKLFFPL